MIKNKKLLLYLGIFTIWLYGAWAVSEMLLMPAISGLGVNEYVYVLLRDVLLKSAVWILPAMLLIKRFSDDMSAGFKERFTFSRASRKYLLIAFALAGFVLFGVVVRTHTLAISSTFHPSKLIVALLVGFTEEIVFRGLYLNAAMKNADTDTKKYIAVGINALMFLVIHFPIWISSGVFVINFKSFAFLTIIALSVLFSFCFIKCRNIWVAAILHSFYDLLVFMFV